MNVFYTSSIEKKERKLQKARNTSINGQMGGRNDIKKQATTKKMVRCSVSEDLLPTPPFDQHTQRCSFNKHTYLPRVSWGKRHIYHIRILQAMTLRNEMENLHKIHEKGNVNLMNENLDLRLSFWFAPLTRFLPFHSDIFSSQKCCHCCCLSRITFLSSLFYSHPLWAHVCCSCPFLLLFANVAVLFLILLPLLHFSRSNHFLSILFSKQTRTIIMYLLFLYSNVLHTYCFDKSVVCKIFEGKQAKIRPRLISNWKIDSQQFKSFSVCVSLAEIKFLKHSQPATQTHAHMYMDRDGITIYFGSCTGKENNERAKKIPTNVCINS